MIAVMVGVSSDNHVQLRRNWVGSGWDLECILVCGMSTEVTWWMEEGDVCDDRCILE